MTDQPKPPEVIYLSRAIAEANVTQPTGFVFLAYILKSTHDAEVKRLARKLSIKEIESDVMSGLISDRDAEVERLRKALSRLVEETTKDREALAKRGYWPHIDHACIHCTADPVRGRPSIPKDWLCAYHEAKRISEERKP